MWTIQKKLTNSMYDLNVFTFEDECHKSVIIKIILKPLLHSWLSAVGLEFQYMCKRSFIIAWKFPMIQ
jgi:hypothetical protein